MALIGSRTLQRNTKEILDKVENDGEAVVILRHGRPAAALVPIDQERAEALVLATSPEFAERRRAREAQPAQRGTPLEVVESEIAGEESEEPAQSAYVRAREELAQGVHVRQVWHQPSEEGSLMRLVQGGYGHGSFLQQIGNTGYLTQMLLSQQSENTRLLAQLVTRLSEQDAIITTLVAQQMPGTGSGGSMTDASATQAPATKKPGE
jgi:prevent-host-death family protein